MAGFSSKFTISLFALLFSLSDAALSPNSFILTSCKPTSYPSLCTQTLGEFALVVRHSPRTLAHAALTISARRAREASTYVTRLSSGPGRDSVRPQTAGALRDCVLMMSDSADRLQQAVHQLGRLGRAGRPSFMLRLSNVQSWASAALTDQSMCLASLVQGKAAGGAATKSRAQLDTRKKVAEASRVTSIALSLVNRLGSRN